MTGYNRLRLVVAGHNRLQPVILILTLRRHRIGDYPGLGEATSMAHAGGHDCHWCMADAQWSNAMRRHDHRCARRSLPDNHPWRGRGVWGEAELRGPPLTRTHESIVAAGLESAESNLPWDSDLHPRKATGVDGECPLARVPLFNLVWDVCMDFMHIVKVMMAGHLIPLLKSERGLTPPCVAANLDRDPEVSR
jgi:hypothetical protein